MSNKVEPVPNLYEQAANILKEVKLEKDQTKVLNKVIKLAEAYEVIIEASKQIDILQQAINHYTQVIQQVRNEK